MTIRSLGGSGEDSRNCFLIEHQEGSFLLDCGVRREIADTDTVYPLLKKEIAISLNFVFLSHAHEDHCAALPYLYNLGYTGKVLCSKETAEAAPKYIAKWCSYVEENNGKLPFSAKDIASIRFEIIPIGKSQFDGINIITGRSGHMLGSLWGRFLIGSDSILYTGDTTFHSILLETDEMLQSNILIVDSAYANQIIDQDSQYLELEKEVRRTLQKGGSAILPVPSGGRGIDIALFLASKGIKVTTDKLLIASTNSLRKNEAWSCISPLWQFSGKLEEAPFLCSTKGVFVVPDGMMTTGMALELYNKLKFDKQSTVIITGHAAKGTPAFEVSDRYQREKHGIRIRFCRTTIKVHLDSNDIKALCNLVKPSKVMLFHSPKENCTALIKELENSGVLSFCGLDVPISMP